MARIRTIKPELTAEMAAELRGFFFGEGHLDLSRSGRGSSLVPRARIALREDDRAILEIIQAWMGGNLSRRAQTRSVCWQLTGFDAVSRLMAVLQGAHLPSKKRREVALISEALTLIPERGRHIPPADAARLHQIRDELKAARRYPEPV